MEIKTRELGKINPKKKFQNKEQAKTLKELSGDRQPIHKTVQGNYCKG